MIEIGKILKRAWHILWNYKILWIFGFILAVTAGGSSVGSNSSYQFSRNRNLNLNGDNPSYQVGPLWQGTNDWFKQNVTPLFDNPGAHINTFIWIGVGFLLFILVVGVIMSILRFVSEAAAIRMVDEYEQTGTRVGFRQGLKLGWSRRAFRMWVIDLVVNLPVIVFIIGLIGMGLLFFFSVINANVGLAVTGAISAVGCAFLIILAFSILMLGLGLLRVFFIRAAALEGAGIADSFRRGWDMFKRNWKSAVLMWLVTLGIGFGYGIVSLILFFVLIPAYILMALPAALVAAIPGAIALGIASIFASGPLVWIIAVLAALPFFIFVALAPLTLIGGWYQIFSTSTWTLTYREMRALEAVKPEALPPSPA
jgi:hypothetical protein